MYTLKNNKIAVNSVETLIKPYIILIPKAEFGISILTRLLVDIPIRKLLNPDKSAKTNTNASKIFPTNPVPVPCLFILTSFLFVINLINFIDII